MSPDVIYTQTRAGNISIRSCAYKENTCTFKNTIIRGRTRSLMVKEVLNKTEMLPFKREEGGSFKCQAREGQCSVFCIGVHDTEGCVSDAEPHDGYRGCF